MTGRGACLIAGCGWVGPVESASAAQSRAVWHVYEVHPDMWAVLVPLGLGSSPTCPQPERAVK